MDLIPDDESVGSLQREDNKIKESIDTAIDSCIGAPHTQGIVSMSELLGEMVRDKLSGQPGELIGYDSATKLYKLEFTEELGDMDPYEAGHCAWRARTEVVILR